MWAAACSKLCPTSLCVHACVCMRLCACILAKVVFKPNQHIRARKVGNHSQTTVVCHFHHLWTSDKLVKRVCLQLQCARMQDLQYVSQWNMLVLLHHIIHHVGRLPTLGTQFTSAQRHSPPCNKAVTAVNVSSPV